MSDKPSQPWNRDARLGLTAVMSGEIEMKQPLPPERLPFRQDVRTQAQGLRAVVRTVEEALRMIDRELPQELRAMPRWTFARALLLEARAHPQETRPDRCRAPAQAGAEQRGLAGLALRRIAKRRRRQR